MPIVECSLGGFLSTEQKIRISVNNMAMLCAFRRICRDLELEVNEDDIEELIMGHEDELTIEELQEILNEEHQKTQ
ncbi:hypothetical protein TNCV_3332041 [Trichonephila clavipes]|nr:hypothetical protein TNCV_3332041 [Trichonephila clavipes]